MLTKTKKVFETIQKVIFLLLILPPTVSFAEGLTEPMVLQMLEDMDKVILEKNAGEVARFISSEANITVHEFGLDGSEPTEMTLEKYLQWLFDEKWNTYPNHEFKRSEVTIEITEGEETATVDSYVLQASTDGSSTIYDERSEVITIKLVNGRALITEMVTYPVVEM